MMAPGHSEMGGKALLAKKMAASGCVHFVVHGSMIYTETSFALTDNRSTRRPTGWSRRVPPSCTSQRRSISQSGYCTPLLSLHTNAQTDMSLLQRGKPVALSSSFATSNNNPLQPVNQNIPLTSEGFLHPSHAKQAQFTLAHQAKAGTPLSEESKPVQQTTNKQQQSAVEDHAAEDDDEEMEM